MIGQRLCSVKGDWSGMISVRGDGGQDWVFKQRGRVVVMVNNEEHQLLRHI